ncbi:putative integral membrane protein duf125 [Golovinomyces cichoracearum]|uniref:Putative integral membrane protein duf125 n=1 Tax=Golovinomyces cichoracearum TaxID=62708 RepID=A0A420J892_9PEZI|nr:putative integral membrane protein duf125 [Golovinomyces cichoracearum]
MDAELSHAVFIRRPNLLRSNGGLELMPEICLRVAEILIDSDPKIIGRLFLISKSYNTLLISYEKSVTKSFSRHKSQLKYVNSSKIMILSSQIGLKSTVLKRQTYPWLSEMRCRIATVKFLLENEITEMVNTIDGWPSLNVSKNELHLRSKWFKTNALFLLFRLADCAAGFHTTEAIRNQQSKFLHSLSTRELAFLGVMVEIIGHNFFIITKRSILEYDVFKEPVRDLLPLQPTSHFNSISEEQINHLNGDDWIRETMCVFEDLIQRHGPFFALAYLEGPKGNFKQPYQWACNKIKEGLENLNSFELGYTMSYASLQSVVWRVFMQKYGCSGKESWIIAKGLVENEMMAYRSDENSHFF